MIRMSRGATRIRSIKNSALNGPRRWVRMHSATGGAHGKTVAKNILDLDGADAEEYFFEESSYCGFDLPPYFLFTPMLTGVQTTLRNEILIEKDFKNFKQLDTANYLIYANKGDRYSWRKLQLINPVLYVKLVEEITEANNWALLQSRFQDFRANSSIKCKSVPTVRLPHQTRLGTQINYWLDNFEGESIRLGLKYEFMFKTDISNCYSSMYTHSVAWAVHTKAVAKSSKSKPNLLGNKIDTFLQSMSNGQTNGIPEGSALMDFIAEMVLGYSDELLGKALDEEGIPNSDFQILRYRDDYRIFVREEQTGETILKLLSRNLMDFGMRLNQSKTGKADHIILDSIKESKLKSYDIHRHELRTSLQLRNELLSLLNSNQTAADSSHRRTRLNQLAKWVQKKPKIYIGHEREILSILLNIAYEKPDTFPIITKFISTLLTYFPAEKQDLFEDILRKMTLLPNSGLIEIWLQRIAMPHGIHLNFEEPLCKLLDSSPNVKIFDDSWQPNSSLAQISLILGFVDRVKLGNLSTKVAMEEISIFPTY